MPRWRSSSRIVGERRGFRFQFQAYNVFNHPEYNGVGTGLQWDATGKQTSVSAGVFNSTLPARILAFSSPFRILGVALSLQIRRPEKFRPPFFFGSAHANVTPFSAATF